MNARIALFFVAPALFAYSGAALHAQQGEAPAAAAPQAKVYAVPVGYYAGAREGERMGRPVGVELTLGQGGGGTLILHQGQFKNWCIGKYVVKTVEVTGDMLTVNATGGVLGCPGTLVLQVVDGGTKLIGALDDSRVELRRR